MSNAVNVLLELTWSRYPLLLNLQFIILLLGLVADVRRDIRDQQTVLVAVRGDHHILEQLNQPHH